MGLGGLFCRYEVSAAGNPATANPDSQNGLGVMRNPTKVSGQQGVPGSPSPGHILFFFSLATFFTKIQLHVGNDWQGLTWIFWGVILFYFVEVFFFFFLKQQTLC